VWYQAKDLKKGVTGSSWMEDEVLDTFLFGIDKISKDTDL